MPRGLSTAIKTELAKDAFTFADLLEIHFSGNIKRLTNFQIPIVTATQTLSSGTYTANGDLLAFDLITETGEAKVNQINISLSGADDSPSGLPSYFLNNNYVDTRVVIYRVFLNSNLQIIDQPVMMFDGEIQSFAINETGKTSTLNIISASVFYDFDRIAGRRTNESSQNAFFPNDKGMEFAAVLLDKVLWGKPGED